MTNATPTANFSNATSRQLRRGAGTATGNAEWDVTPVPFVTLLTQQGEGRQKSMRITIELGCLRTPEWQTRMLRANPMWVPDRLFSVSALPIGANLTA